MIELRLRSKVSERELNQKIGKVLTPEDYNLLLTRAARVLKPNGKPLCVYVPGYLADEMDAAYPILRRLRGKTDNRGLASGTKRISAGGNRTRSMPVMSSIMGAMDPAPNRDYCRLTSYTRDNLEKWEALKPLLRRIAEGFSEHVPQRYAAQAEYAVRTHKDWMVWGTPFTTITVNNSYATGVHTDKGDLEEGFSCLAVCRRGTFTGGYLTFPEYRVAVDMQDGDLLLMDAHEWHGNTRLRCSCLHPDNQMSEGPCSLCLAERISVVCYYRTEMKKCQSRQEEDARRIAWSESRVKSGV